MIRKSLVVNDDEVSLFIVSKMLHKTNFSSQVVTADNGEKALSYFDEVVSLGVEHYDDAPEYIFLDLHMPVMSGWDFIEIFTEKYALLFPETKVIILSASAEEDEIIRLQKYDLVTDFICTPMTMDKLEKIKNKFYIVPPTDSFLENYGSLVL